MRRGAWWFLWVVFATSVVGCREGASSPGEEMGEQRPLLEEAPTANTELVEQEAREASAEAQPAAAEAFGEPEDSGAVEAAEVEPARAGLEPESEELPSEEKTLAEEEEEWELKSIEPRSTSGLPLDLPKFREALCPFPTSMPGALSVYAAVTGERTHCLEKVWMLQRIRRMGADFTNDGWRQDNAFESWAIAQCDVYEEKEWVYVPTREWSDGTAWGLRTDQCRQRMLEERLFLYEAKERGVHVFRKLVDARQAAGRRVREELVALREQTVQKPKPREQYGPILPLRWREFIHHLDVVIETPRTLAQQHCPFQRDGPANCRERLENYFFSMGLDEHEAR